MKSFQQEIAEAFENNGSDKEWNHNYAHGYAKILFDQNVKNLLEIGLANNTIEKTSLNAWTSLFPEANIFGKNLKTFNIDQSDYGALVKWARELGIEFDVIVDDGSHQFEHAKASFEALFPFIAKSGVYIIEDVAKDNNSLAIPNQQTLEDWTQFLKSIRGHAAKIYDCKEGASDDSVLIEIRKVDQ
jgi:hypothetical protein